MKRINVTQLAESYGTVLNNETFQLDDGREVSRTVVRRPDAAAVVAFTEDNQVIMIRQAREAVGEAALLEIPAGKIDPGETPAEAAARELEEEVGVVADSLEPIRSIFPSPGYTAEEIHLFVARGLTQTAQSLDDDERIDIFPMDIDEAIGATSDAKSLVALLSVR